MNNFFSNKKSFRSYFVIKKNLGLAISALLGAIFFLVVSYNILPPTNIEWILTDGWDTFQHQIGWEFFRVASWSYPIGLASNYGFPVGIPITYTDSLPLLAIPFKIVRNFLPETFQYFGLWHLFAFILQGIFGYLLCKLVCQKKAESVIGSIFFIISPIMLFRVGGHASLVGHFLILASLWLILRKHNAAQSWQWGALLIISLLVHPYFLFMAAPLWLADSIILILRRQNKIITMAWHGLIILAAIFVISFVIGVFYIGNPHAFGYGDFSMNLNAPFNPWGWSRLLPDLPLQRFQFEGFNYLGVGIIFLFVLSFIVILLRRDFNLHLFLRRWWPLLLICLLFALFSLSNKIYFGNLKIIEIPLPNYFKNALGAIPSTGRFFWPVYYLMILFSLMIIRYLRRPLSVVLLVFVVAVQFFDISEALVRQHKYYANRIWKNTLISEFWKNVPQHFSHIVYIPEFDPNFYKYAPIAMFAVRHGLTLNTGYFSRNIKGDGDHLKQQIESLWEGKIDSKALYIFTANPKMYVSSTHNYVIGKIDEYEILLSNTSSLAMYLNKQYDK